MVPSFKRGGGALGRSSYPARILTSWCLFWETGFLRVPVLWDLCVSYGLGTIPPTYDPEDIVSCSATSSRDSMSWQNPTVSSWEWVLICRQNPTVPFLGWVKLSEALFFKLCWGFDLSFPYSSRRVWLGNHCGPSCLYCCTLVAIFNIFRARYRIGLL